MIQIGASKPLSLKHCLRMLPVVPPLRPSPGSCAGAGAVPARPADLARGAAAARAPGRQVARDAREPPEAAAHHDDAAGAGACAAPASDDDRQAHLEVGLEQEGPAAARASSGLLVLTLFHCSPPLDDLHDDELQRRDLLAAAVGLRLVLQLLHLGQQPHDDVSHLADAADGRA